MRRKEEWFLSSVYELSLSVPQDYHYNGLNRTPSEIKKEEERNNLDADAIASVPQAAAVFFFTHTQMDKVAIRAKDHSQRSIGNCACRCVQAVNV